MNIREARIDGFNEGYADFKRCGSCESSIGSCLEANEKYQSYRGRIILIGSEGHEIDLGEIVFKPNYRRGWDAAALDRGFIVPSSPDTHSSPLILEYGSRTDMAPGFEINPVPPGGQYSGQSWGGSSSGGSCNPPPSRPGGDTPDDTTAIGSSSIPEGSNINRDFEALMKRVKSNPDFEGHMELLEEKTEQFLNSTYSFYEVLYNFTNGSIESIETLEDSLDLLDNMSAEQNATLLELALTNDEYYNEFSFARDVVFRDYRNATDITILENGWYSSTRSLVNNLEFMNYLLYDSEPFTQPILVIPSGGLYGMDSSEMFKSKLEKYVSEGGTLIVFSQQHGYEFQVVPGGNLTGHGWLEDQSCFAKAVYIDTYHPVLSGQDSVTLDLAVDGYFTSWPENASILLRRTKNGMPAMVMYPYGNGTVIATSAYTDWAYTHGQSSRDGVVLVRDMLEWAKAKAANQTVEEYGHNTTVNVSVEVEYRPAYYDPLVESYKITYVVFRIYDPEGNLYDTITVQVDIEAFEKVYVHAYPDVQSTPGVWTVDYDLLNETNDTAQVDYDVAKFAVSGNFSSDFAKRLYRIDNITENGGREDGSL